MMTEAEKKARLAELRKSEKLFLVPTEIAPVLGCNPYSINLQAKEDQSKLGFPVSKIGTNVKIPREAFLKWFDGLQQ